MSLDGVAALMVVTFVEHDAKVPTTARHATVKGLNLRIVYFAEEGKLKRIDGILLTLSNILLSSCCF